MIEEVPLALFVNGRHAMTAMMSPVQLEDFVTGYLYTEQIIKNVDEIESIRIEKNRMSVITKNLFKVLGPKKTILSGCGGSTSFIDTEKLPKITSDYTISTADIRNAAKAVLNSELHHEDGGDPYRCPAGQGKRSSQSPRISGGTMRSTASSGSRSATRSISTKTWVIVSGRISSEMVQEVPDRGYPDHRLPRGNHHACRGNGREDRSHRSRVRPQQQDGCLHPHPDA